jgi:probable HAF family extracellular repeat protein
MIVGASARTDLRTHAFAFDPDTGVMVDLGTLGGTSSTAYGINRHGTVVGESRDSGGRIRAFVWRAVTGMEALGTLGGISSVAYGVNTDGVVVGESHDVAGHVRAFRTNGDALEDLGTLGGSSSRATAVNDSGQATGSAMTPAGEEHAFRFDPGVGLTDLGTLGGPLSSGEAINAHGHVVGWSLGVDGNIHAFLWTPDSGLVDLNTVAPLPPGTHLVAAYGITDEGQIAGYGVFGGTAMAFRLTVRQAERDVTPPVIHALSATPDRLWPPRHDLVPVTLTVTSTDDSGDPPTCHVVSVSSSEPDASGEADDSSSSSIASTGESGLSTLRSTQTRLRSSRGSSSSSFRVPLFVMSIDGKTRLSVSLRSRWISMLPVPLNSSKITSSMREPVSTSAVADDGERAALLDVARGAEEPLRLLQRVRVEAAREHLARGRDHRVVGAREAGDRVEQDEHVLAVLDEPLGLLDDHLGDLHVALRRLVEGRRDHLAVDRSLHVGDLLGPLVDEQHDQVDLRVVGATDCAMLCSSIVLPVRGGATMSPRCPLPIGVIRSMTRAERLSRSVSSRMASCG